ncbi:hypothetical protein MUG10_04515 [Xanthomonas prunicola]|uniref:Uncharacterized protein n=1 Tax=Xanthomonas prunicola TaxID=2053930 RepID=A0A9Q9J0F4_9XANT|nr:hypothetical protein [Xanthomonas prunicola]USJ01471.1 hypothetical protein MUG10_04515 [Xanthomonas prunicola]UXA52271.1 hypothetical protein M0D45_16540 [Xanthomonas prunicola]UXA66519.1 hypothetical protein M0D43_05795 [Xanthomonas prunicola]
MSGALRHSILGQVGVFAIVGPPFGGLLGLVLLPRFDLQTALSIVVWSYGLVLPVIACTAAGALCARVCAWRYRGRRPNLLVHVGIGALSGLLSTGVIVLLLAIIGGWSMMSDRAVMLTLLQCGLAAGGACAVLVWLMWSRLAVLPRAK